MDADHMPGREKPIRRRKPKNRVSDRHAQTSRFKIHYQGETKGKLVVLCISHEMTPRVTVHMWRCVWPKLSSSYIVIGREA